MKPLHYNHHYGMYAGNGYTLGNAYHGHPMSGATRMYPQAGYRNYPSNVGFPLTFAHPVYGRELWNKQETRPRLDRESNQIYSGKSSLMKLRVYGLTLFQHVDSEDPQREIKAGAGIHPTLDSDKTTRLFNVRQRPDWSLQDTFWWVRHEKAIRGTDCRLVRLVSRDFPWTIDIHPHVRSRVPYVTCGDILYGLYEYFWLDMDAVDWRFVLGLEEDQQKAVKDTIELRIRGNGSVAKKIDWLVKKVLFRGLIKDDDFAQSLLPPGHQLYPYTYVVKLVECKYSYYIHV